MRTIMCGLLEGAFRKRSHRKKEICHIVELSAARIKDTHQQVDWLRQNIVSGLFKASMLGSFLLHNIKQPSKDLD